MSEILVCLFAATYRKLQFVIKLVLSLLFPIPWISNLTLHLEFGNPILPEAVTSIGNKKLSYRRGTARRTVSLKMSTCTTVVRKIPSKKLAVGE